MKAITIRATNGEEIDVEVVGAYVRVECPVEEGGALLDLHAARELIEALVTATNEAAVHSAAVALKDRA